MQHLNIRNCSESKHKIYIAHHVCLSIQNTIGSFPAESGGILACNSNNEIIDFWYDHEAGAGKTRYIPSSHGIANYINHVWRKKNYHFCGIVHSHPSYATSYPSPADIIYADTILKANRLKVLQLIILCNDELRCFSIHADSCKIDKVIEVTLVLSIN